MLKLYLKDYMQTRESQIEPNSTGQMHCAGLSSLGHEHFTQFEQFIQWSIPLPLEGARVPLVGRVPHFATPWPKINQISHKTTLQNF